MNGCHVQPEQMFNLIFGYSNTLADKTDVTASGAAEDIDSTPCPVDEVWVVTHVAVRNDDRAVLSLLLSVMVGGSTEMYVDFSVPGATSFVDGLRCRLVLKYLDKIRGSVGGSQNGDTCHLYVHGYKMKVTQ